jgi:hypothetical protein
LHAFANSFELDGTERVYVMAGRLTKRKWIALSDAAFVAVLRLRR